jgi:chemotaxis protein CheD
MTLAENPTLIVAGIGEMVFSADPDSHLVAYGIGSCVALAAWDPQKRIGGLAHFMLPSGPPTGASPVKFIATGLDTFLNELEAQGASLSRTVFKAAGGAAMLTVGKGVSIGMRNHETILAALAERNLQLTASALGGSIGRTVQLGVGDGRLLIMSLSSVAEI